MAAFSHFDMKTRTSVLCVSSQETGKVHSCARAGVRHPLHHLRWDASYISGTKLGNPNVLWAVFQLISGTFCVTQHVMSASHPLLPVKNAPSSKHTCTRSFCSDFWRSMKGMQFWCTEQMHFSWSLGLALDLLHNILATLTKKQKHFVFLTFALFFCLWKLSAGQSKHYLAS